MNYGEHHPSSPLSNQNQPSRVRPRASSAGAWSNQSIMTPILPARDAYAGECMHGVMEIEHLDSYRYKCDVCRKEPSLGWLYRCKMDAWAAEYNNAEEPFLSPWIMKAIEEGKYTDDQISILYQHKEDVLERVDAFKTASPASDIDPFYLEGRYPDLAESDEEPHSEFIENAAALVKPRWIRERPRCYYKVCHRCRPHIQRAYISLDTVCNEPNIRLPSPDEAAKLPVVDADICRTLLVDRPPIRICADAEEDANTELQQEEEFQQLDYREDQGIDARLEDLAVVHEACRRFLIELVDFLTTSGDNTTVQFEGGNEETDEPRNAQG